MLVFKLKGHRIILFNYFIKMEHENQYVVRIKKLITIQNSIANHTGFHA